MNAKELAIQIIPDFTIDDKYMAIIGDALSRIQSFTGKALRDTRLGELYVLSKSRIDEESAFKLLSDEGKLLVGFQFEMKADVSQHIFHLYVKKETNHGKTTKLYLTPAIQEIMLQMISLEDRRSVAIFSMLSSSLEVSYRILTTLYGHQLKRLKEKVPGFLLDSVNDRSNRLAVARNVEDSGAWDSAKELQVPGTGEVKGDRPGTQDNILQVLADDGVFSEINQYVETVTSRIDRIREKRLQLEQNQDMPRPELYQTMIRDDLDQLENCYARMHIYLKAFYKNKEKRISNQNKILRQFFGNQIEKIMGEASLLEDFLSLNEYEYFKNLARHQEL